MSITSSTPSKAATGAAAVGTGAAVVNPFTKNMHSDITADFFEANAIVGVAFYDGKNYYTCSMPKDRFGYHEPNANSKDQQGSVGWRSVSAQASFLDIEGPGSLGEKERKDAIKNRTKVPLNKMKHNGEIELFYFSPNMLADLKAEGTYDSLMVEQRACANNFLLAFEFLWRKLMLKHHLLMMKRRQAAVDDNKQFDEPIINEKFDTYLSKGMQAAERSAAERKRDATDDDVLHYAAIEYLDDLKFDKEATLIARTQHPDNMKTKKSQHRQNHPLPTKQELVAFIVKLANARRNGGNEWQTMEHDEGYEYEYTTGKNGKPRGKWAVIIKGSKPSLLQPTDKSVLDKPLSAVHEWSEAGFVSEKYIDEEIKAYQFRPWHTSVAELVPGKEPGKMIMRYKNREEVEQRNAAAAFRAKAEGKTEMPKPERMVPYGSLVSIYLSLQPTTKLSMRRNLTGAVVVVREGKNEYQATEYDATETAYVKYAPVKKEEPAADGAAAANGESSAIGVKRDRPDESSAASTTSVNGDIEGSDAKRANAGGLPRPAFAGAPTPTATSAMQS